VRTDLLIWRLKLKEILLFFRTAMIKLGILFLLISLELQLRM
jgi:hypothetical protein